MSTYVRIDYEVEGGRREKEARSWKLTSFLTTFVGQLQLSNETDDDIVEVHCYVVDN